MSAIQPRTEETPSGEFEYQRAKRDTQRHLDAVSLSTHITVDGRRNTGPTPPPDFSAVLRTLMGAGPLEDQDSKAPEPVADVVVLRMLTTLHLEGDVYYEKGELHTFAPRDAKDLIGWLRAREVTDEEIDEHNRIVQCMMDQAGLDPVGSCG